MKKLELRMNGLPRTIEVRNSAVGVVLSYIDQQELPKRLSVVETSSWRQVVKAIQALSIRGAPAIGVAGAAALMLWTHEMIANGSSDAVIRSRLPEVVEDIASARPTAVNLRWAVERTKNELLISIRDERGLDKAGERLFNFVKQLEREDEMTNRAIGDNGAKLLEYGSRVLTHCNAGSLATVFYGTALGVVYSAASQGKIKRVYADETRPVGQGARLTTWELARAGVPVTLICDNMAASLMASGRVDAVIVGADRIAKNGDTANKIGTYGVAVLAHEHQIPFYVAAPTSTVDASASSGASIEIEQRSCDEVLTDPIPGVDVLNPAFDITPARYITRIVTEKGAFLPQEIAMSL